MRERPSEEPDPDIHSRTTSYIRHSDSSLLVLLALSNDYSVQELDYTPEYDAHGGAGTADDLEY